MSKKVYGIEDATIQEWRDLIKSAKEMRFERDFVTFDETDHTSFFKGYIGHQARILEKLDRILEKIQS